MKQKHRILLGTISIMILGFLTVATIPYARAQVTCTFTTMDTAPDECPPAKDILKTNQAYMQAWAAGDAAGLAALYTEDALLMAPNAPAFEGRAKIQNLLDTLIQGGIVKNTLTTFEIEMKGQTAWERGHYALALADGSIVDVGKYIVIWKKVQRQWMLHRDIFNSDRPLPMVWSLPQ